MKDIFQKIVNESQNYDVSNLTHKQLNRIENLENYIFEKYLPYKAKNGIYFSTNGVSLNASKGLVFFRNYGSHGKNNNGENLYRLMLIYSPQYSQETKYNLSCVIESLDKKALELISNKIKEAEFLFAKNLMK